MKILYLIVVYLFILCQIGLSQHKHDSNWVLGYDNDLGIPGGDGTMVTFGENETTFTYFEKGMEMRTHNATVSDSSGRLLFYSNGCYIANAEHNPMQGGNYLNPGTVHSDFCDHGYPMQQGMLALPDLEDENLYHVLHTRYASPPFHSDILYRTTVDMTLDGGLGGATEKNVPLIEDSLWAGYLTATKHANNNDWWIISAKGFTNRYYKILYSNEGFEIKGEQEIGWALDYAGAGGQAVFSPNGEKYVWYDQIRNVMLFDFDRATGEFSNPQQLHVADTIYFGGAAISPNNRFLYISNAIYLYQYDLMADDIQASQVVIDTFDGFSSPFPANFFLMQLAPDCRIYMSTGNGTDRLHVIHHPNRKGKDCGFEQHAVHLPKDNFSTIPNFPNYRLGTPYPVCDSTIQLVTSSVSVSVSLVEVKVWPNPASGQLGVELPKPLIGDGQWSLYSAMGQQVLSHKMERGSAKAAVFLEDVPNGLYFWEMTSNGERLDSGKLLIAK